MRVDFMLIGAIKAGTTSLTSQLAEHPGICFSRVKEPDYFNRVTDWESDLDLYHQLFEPREGQLCGEGSTLYTYLPEWPDTSRRLHAYNPDLKLIYIMRNPIDKIISHYSHNLVRGTEKRTPAEAVADNGRYINSTRYAVQIRPYLELFGRSNVLLLIFEEYVADQLATLDTVARFLGISADAFANADAETQHRTVGTPYLKHESVAKLTRTPLFRTLRDFVPQQVRHPIRYRLLSNKLAEKPVFDEELRQVIWRFVADDVRAIEELLGRQLPVWQGDQVS